MAPVRADQQQLAAYEPPPNTVVVVGAAVRRDHRLLFVRQRSGALAGHWCLPTGLPEPGEAPELAAVREIHEEAGITAEVQGVLAVSNIEWHGRRQLYIVFLCEHVAGEPVPDQHETDRAAYLSLTDIEHIDEPFVPLATLLAQNIAAGTHHVLPAEDIRSLSPFYRTAFL